VLRNRNKTTILAAPRATHQPLTHSAGPDSIKGALAATRAGHALLTDPENHAKKYTAANMQWLHAAYATPVAQTPFSSIASSN
jgi:hypothetical protein